MTAHLVVPTLAGAPPQNQSLEGFWVASCESRANPNLALCEAKFFRQHKAWDQDQAV
jgi:hypothetical protein